MSFSESDFSKNFSFPGFSTPLLIKKLNNNSSSSVSSLGLLTSDQFLSKFSDSFEEEHSNNRKKLLDFSPSPLLSDPFYRNSIRKIPSIDKENILPDSYPCASDTGDLTRYFGLKTSRLGESLTPYSPPDLKSKVLSTFENRGCLNESLISALVDSETEFSPEAWARLLVGKIEDSIFETSYSPPSFLELSSRKPKITSPRHSSPTNARLEFRPTKDLSFGTLVRGCRCDRVIRIRSREGSYRKLKLIASDSNLKFTSNLEDSVIIDCRSDNGWIDISVSLLCTDEHSYVKDWKGSIRVVDFRNTHEVLFVYQATAVFGRGDLLIEKKHFVISRGEDIKRIRFKNLGNVAFEAEAYFKPPSKGLEVSQSTVQCLPGVETFIDVYYESFEQSEKFNLILQISPNGQIYDIPVYFADFFPIEGSHTSLKWKTSGIQTLSLRNSSSKMIDLYLSLRQSGDHTFYLKNSFGEDSIETKIGFPARTTRTIDIRYKPSNRAASSHKAELVLKPGNRIPPVKATIKLSGEFVRKEVYLDPSKIVFNDTLVKDASTSKVIIKNKSSESITFLLRGIQSPFRSKYSQFIVKPKSYLGFLVKFEPKTTGHFHQLFELCSDKIVLEGSLSASSTDCNLSGLRI